MKKIQIIAEVGVNHNGSIKLAKKLIDSAKKSGADYVKFQTYKTEKLLNKKVKLANYQKKNTSYKNQYDMLSKYQLSFEDFYKLKSYCIKKKIKFLSTPFDQDSVSLLSKMKLNMVKISSGDFNNLPLIHSCLNFKKIILSTGLADKKEIDLVINFVKKFKKIKNIILLHCNTDYPTNLKDVNLQAIPYLSNLYNIPIGFSDHTQGIIAPLGAASLGAKYIEKHLTLDKNMPGPDHICSIEPEEFTVMVKNIRKIELMIGKKNKFITPSAKKNLLPSSKSIIAKKDIFKGQRFTIDNLDIKRPGGGISPINWYKLLGKQSNYSFKKGDFIVL